MQNNGTSVLERTEAGQVSPVIDGPAWFEYDDEDVRPHTLRMHLPLSAELMVAALYHDGRFLRAADLATDECVWGTVALAIAQDGLNAIEARAGQLRYAEATGQVDAPDWLAIVRQRVAEVTAR